MTMKAPWVLAFGFVVVAQSMKATPECISLGDNPQDCQFDGAFACFAAAFGPDPIVGQGAAGYCNKPNASQAAVHAAATRIFLDTHANDGAMRGNFDGITLGPDGSLNVRGWAVDPTSEGSGRGSVPVGVTVDGHVMWTGYANASRPDLVLHHVAPDPMHGLDTIIASSLVQKSGLLTGNHTVTLVAWRVADRQHKTPPVPLGTSKCVTDGRVDTYCGGPPEPIAWSCCKSRPANIPPAPSDPIVPTPYPLPPASRPSKASTSVVLFLTDDQDKMLGSVNVMNRTKALFVDGGAVFDNYFVTTPICCPSRISLLSGRWAHNTGAVATTPAGWCSVGKYWQGPMQNKSLPNYLKAAGVRTGIFGKETNANTADYISPGWDRFFVLGGSSEGHYYADWFADQGQQFNAGQDDYMTDLIQDRAIAWIKEVAATPGPFFAYIAPHAPHTRATPPTWARSYFEGVEAPRLASWNQSMPDHHWLVRSQEPLSELCAGHSDQLYRNRLQALLGVDALVGAVADTIQSLGRLDSTYFLYTSDHGFHLGEMRMPYFKAQPYDTDIRVPFMIRGPGIKPGSSVPNIALNVDIAPTIADLFYTQPFEESLTDGHSLVPLVLGDNRPRDEDWRQDFVFEFWAGGKPNTLPRGPYCDHAIMAYNNTYAGVRTLTGLKYVDFRPYEDIEEAFNVTADPYEMHNLAKDADAQVWVNELRARLNVLRNCTQSECW
eukprot:m.51112 g.51112  ORF g.51112 m.51112 type:complete len:719 (+) comp7286_c0_seq1:47-2203(+)